MPIYNRVKYYSLNRPYWDIEVIPGSFPDKIYISGLPLSGGYDFNGCYSYNDIAYIDFDFSTPPLVETIYRTGKNPKTDLYYATYTFDNDPTQVILSTFNLDYLDLTYEIFNVNDVSIVGFTNGQDLGYNVDTAEQIENLSQAPNKVYYPKLGTFTETWGTYTISDTCP